jgi:hypothetical protein
MTLLVIMLLFVAALAGISYGYRRDLARIPAPTVEDPNLSAYAGGFGPEWNPLIARTEEAG